MRTPVRRLLWSTIVKVKVKGRWQCSPEYEPRCERGDWGFRNDLGKLRDLIDGLDIGVKGKWKNRRPFLGF